jgi:hypothetical protein
MNEICIVSTPRVQAVGFSDRPGVNSQRFYRHRLTFLLPATATPHALASLRLRLPISAWLSNNRARLARGTMEVRNDANDQADYTFAVCDVAGRLVSLGPARPAVADAGFRFWSLAAYICRAGCAKAAGFRVWWSLVPAYEIGCIKEFPIFTTTAPGGLCAFIIKACAP